MLLYLLHIKKLFFVKGQVFTITVKLPGLLHLYSFPPNSETPVFQTIACLGSLPARGVSEL